MKRILITVLLLTAIYANAQTDTIFHPEFKRDTVFVKGLLDRVNSLENIITNIQVQIEHSNMYKVVDMNSPENHKYVSPDGSVTDSVTNRIRLFLHLH
jgi:hypothetical protein